MTPPSALPHAIDPPLRPRRSAGGRGGDLTQTARARRDALRRRAQRIRVWVVSLAITVFLAIWALLFWNIVSDHVAATTTRTTSALVSTGSSSPSGSSSASGSSGTSGTSGSSGSSGSSASSGTGTVSSVTSGQS